MHPFSQMTDSYVTFHTVARKVLYICAPTNERWNTRTSRRKKKWGRKKKEKRSALDASRRNICTAVTTTSCEQRAEASNETNLLLVRFASQDRIIRITRKAPGPLPLPEDDADIGGSSLCTCLSFLPFFFLLLLSLILFFSCVVLDCKLERSSRDVLIINHGHRSSSCWGFFLFFCCATISSRFESVVSSFFFSPFSSFRPLIHFYFTSLLFVRFMSRFF